MCISVLSFPSFEMIPSPWLTWNVASLMMKLLGLAGSTLAGACGGAGALPWKACGALWETWWWAPVSWCTAKVEASLWPNGTALEMEAWTLEGAATTEFWEDAVRIVAGATDTWDVRAASTGLEAVFEGATDTTEALSWPGGLAAEPEP